jgi:hypothetical protein
MERRQRVVLYGQSVILGAVQASLRRDPQLEAVSLAPPATVQELAAFAPDVILFDTDQGCSGPAFALLRTCPGLLLIGIDPASEQLLVLSSTARQALSIEDLVNVIELKKTTVQ